MKEEPTASNRTLESIIADKRVAIKRKEEKIASLEGELDSIKADLEKDRNALQALIVVRDEEIAKAKSAQADHQAWTISSAAADILKKISTKKAHADQILLHFAEYGLAVSKAALTSQLAKDRHLFLPLGGNVFQLIESSELSKPATLPVATTQNADHTSGAIDNVPLGSKAVNTLREEIQEPKSTGEIKSFMVERGLVEDNKNLFPWLHTALKRKEKQGEVILGEDKKWRLPEWEKVKKSVEEIQGEHTPEQVSALQTETATESPVAAQ